MRLLFKNHASKRRMQCSIYSVEQQRKSQWPKFLYPVKLPFKSEGGINIIGRTVFPGHLLCKKHVKEVLWGEGKWCGSGTWIYIKFSNSRRSWLQTEETCQVWRGALHNHKGVNSLRRRNGPQSVSAQQQSFKIHETTTGRTSRRNSWIHADSWKL